jgi:hypothetical protein
VEEFLKLRSNKDISLDLDEETASDIISKSKQIAGSRS